MSVQTYSLTVTGSNYKIESNECPWGVIGSCGNVACQFNSETEEVKFTDRAWRNWAPILEAKAEQIAVTDSDAGYSGEVLDFADLVTYLQGVMVSPEGGGGGGESVSWGDITGDIGDNTDLANALDGKQATLTFDNSPTENSTNPVKSGGVFTALAGKADASTVRFVIHAEYNVGTGAVTLASTTTQAALMEALMAKKAMDIDFTIAGTYYRNPMLSFYDDGTGAHEVRFRNDAMGFDVVLTANTTSNTYAFDVRQFVMTESAYGNLQSVDPTLIYYLTADPQS